MNSIANNEVKVTIYGAYEIDGDLYIPGTVVFEEGSSLLLHGTSSFNCDKVITCVGFSVMSMDKQNVEEKVANTELSKRAATGQQERVQSPVTEKNEVENKKASPVVSAKADDKPVVQQETANAIDELVKEQSVHSVQDEKSGADIPQNISVNSEKPAQEEVAEEEEEIVAEEESKETSKTSVVSKKEESVKEPLYVVAEKAQEELGEKELNEEEEEEESSSEVVVSKKEESVKEHNSVAIKQSEYDIFDFDVCPSGIQSQLKNSGNFLQSQVMKDNFSDQDLVLEEQAKQQEEVIVNSKEKTEDALEQDNSLTSENVITSDVKEDKVSKE